MRFAMNNNIGEIHLHLNMIGVFLTQLDEQKHLRP